MPATTKKGQSTAVRRKPRQTRSRSGKSVVWKNGRPTAVILPIMEYFELIAPTPKILRQIGEESVRHGTDKITVAEIDEIIQEVRRERSLRRRRNGAA